MATALSRLHMSDHKSHGSRPVPTRPHLVWLVGFQPVSRPSPSLQVPAKTQLSAGGVLVATGIKPQSTYPISIQVELLNPSWLPSRYIRSNTDLGVRLPPLIAYPRPTHRANTRCRWFPPCPSLTGPDMDLPTRRIQVEIIPDVWPR